MDKKILFAFMRLAQINKYLTQLSHMTVKISSKAFFCLYVLTGLYLIYKRDERIGLFLFVPFICLLTSYGLRFIVKKPRPYKKYSYRLNFDMDRKNSYSFPSNHSTSSMVIAAACMFVNIYFGSVILIFAVITGLSRVFMGIHYLSDVLAGWILGMVFGAVGFHIIDFMRALMI